MSRSLGARLGWRLSRLLAPGSRPGIYYVIDDADWSFFWDGRYITDGLRDRHGRKTEIIRRVGGLKGQIIQFGSRYQFLHKSSRSLHLYNRVFLTWFHGDAADPELAPYFDILARVAEEAEKIVVPCALTMTPLLELGLPFEQLAVIPLGVELGHFHPPSAEDRKKIRNDLGLPSDAVVVGSFQKDGVGWGEGMEAKPVKGPDVFLETVSIMAGRHPRLFVLLTGPSRGYVKAGLDKIGVPYIHHMLDNYRDIVRYYQALDLYIIASRCEGGPKALLESWACGVPLVSTRVGMCADLMIDGVNGVMVAQEDAQALAEGALRLLDDSCFRERTAAEGLKRVADYGWNSIVDRYMSELYAPISDD